MTAFAKLRSVLRDIYVSVDDIAYFLAALHDPSKTVIKLRSGPVEQISLDLDEVKRRLAGIPGVWLDDGEQEKEVFQVGHFDRDNDDPRSYREGLSRLRGPDPLVSGARRERVDGGPAE